MGYSHLPLRQRLEAEREEREYREELAKEEAEAATARRMALADKIVLAVVDRISADIIRPGPKPEERECYVMAQELRDHSEHLAGLVADILKVEQDEGDA